MSTSDKTGYFPDDDVPESAWVNGETAATDLDFEFDFVVVGTGAAGAAAAHTLTVAGFSVAMVEEGPWIKTREITEDVYGMFRRGMRDGATQAIEGRAFMPLLQGRCVGGSTLINSAIAWRMPGDVVHDWSKNYGLGNTLTEKGLAPHFDALEAELSVLAVADEMLGVNNQLFLEQTKKSGIVSSPMKRYDIDSSIFQTNLGVNPQHSIMAIARLVATLAADRHSNA